MPNPTGPVVPTSSTAPEARQADSISLRHLASPLAVVDDSLVLTLKQALAETPADFKLIPPGLFNAETAMLSIRTNAYENAKAELERASAKGIIPAGAQLGAAVDLNKIDLRGVVVRGYWHLVDDKPCQDRIFNTGVSAAGNLAVALSDGVSSGKLAHFGAQLLSQAAAIIAIQLLEEPKSTYLINGSFLNANFLGELYARLAEVQIALCQETQFHPLDAGDLFLPATLQLLIATPREVAVFGAADGLIDRGRGAVESFEAITERQRPSFNTPPLLCRVIEDPARRQLRARGLPQFSADAGELARIEEVKSLSLVHFAQTEVFVTREFSMWSDGGSYTDVTRGTVRSFPFAELLRNTSWPISFIREAANLQHLVMAAHEYGQDSVLLESSSKVLDATKRFDLSSVRSLLDEASNRQHVERRLVEFLENKLRVKIVLGEVADQGLRQERLLGYVRPHQNKWMNAELQAFLATQQDELLRAGYEVALELVGAGRERPCAEFVDVVPTSIDWARRQLQDRSVDEFVSSVAGASAQELLLILATQGGQFGHFKAALLSSLGSSALKVLSSKHGIDATLHECAICDDLAGVMLLPKKTS